MSILRKRDSDSESDGELSEVESLEERKTQESG